MKSKEEVLREAFHELDQGVAPEQVLREVVEYYSKNLDKVKERVAKIMSNVATTFQKVGELDRMLNTPGVIPAIHLHMLQLSGIRNQEDRHKFLLNLQKRHVKATQPKE